MRKSFFKLALAAATVSLLGTGVDALAGTNPKSTGKKRSQEEVLRTGKLLDLQQNTVSNIRFYTTNYGIFGLNVDANAGGGFWPRTSSNQYIFGGGVWFAALKRVDDSFNKLVAISYNPNSGQSWFVPGRVGDGDEIVAEADKIQKYRTYFSTDFGGDGAPLLSKDGPNWPIWDAGQAKDTLKSERYLGTYVDDISQRNVTAIPKGPAYISEEDIFSTFKDTDLRYYEGGEVQARKRGYPMRLDIEHTTYSWGFGQYRNFMFLAYTIINRSTDTLRDCWMAPAMDMDIAKAPNTQAGASNDRVRYYEEDPSLNLAVQWTDGNQGEAGQGFGYIGFDFLESPIVNKDKRIESDRDLTQAEIDSLSNYIDSAKVHYDSLLAENAIGEADLLMHRRLRALTDRQLSVINSEFRRPGLKTFRNWVIENDPTDDGARYDFMTLGVKEGDNGPGDKRFLMATGPFDLYPNDTARVVVGLIIARTASGSDATGSADDTRELVRTDQFAQRVYDDNFRTPVPPDRANATWTPLNNGVVVSWDEASEKSVDELENGLDFMGYILYRARRTDFDVDEKPYDADVRPFGWKKLAEWTLPSPFLTSRARSIVDDTLSPYIDSLRIVSLGGTNKNIYTVERFGNGAWADFFNSLTQAEFTGLLRGTIEVNKANVPNPQNSVSDLYTYIQNGYAEIKFNDIGKMPAAIAFINKYMDSVTNGRTYVDIGDDNKNGQIDETADLRTTERLINNVDYYYFVRAYDQGDQSILSPRKNNSGRNGQNLIRATPMAPPAGMESKIDIVMSEADRKKFAGFYNFRFPVEDADLLRQLFSGHTLEVTFTPIWGAARFPFSQAGATPYGFYGRQVDVRDVTEGRLLASYDVFPNNFSENAAIFASGNDSLGIGVSDSKLKSIRTGTVTTKSFLYAPDQVIKGAFSFAFDYAIQQWGGIYRTDTSYVAQGDADANIRFSNAGAKTVDTAFVNGLGRWQGNNNGPAEYEVEFLPGSSEDMSLTFGGAGDLRTITANVAYLNVQVKNLVSYERPSPTGQKVLVDYPEVVPHFTIANIDANGTAWPDAKDVPIGTYNLSAYAWVNGRNGDNLVSDRPKQAAGPSSIANSQNKGIPIGTQGRYYLSATIGSDVIDFVHILMASGSEFAMDFANKRGRKASPPQWTKQTDQPTRDFEAGDKVVFSLLGGALGFPEPDAKFTVNISNGFPALADYTDEMLEQVKVVPNPYYVTHIGQTTTDAGRLYLTHLPPKCTIIIYNIAGDLIKTIEHDDLAVEEPGNHPIEIWNLISESQQQVGSQTLIAQIKTPNGAESLVKFTVVMGGFRLVPE